MTVVDEPATQQGAALEEERVQTPRTDPPLVDPPRNDAPASEPRPDALRDEEPHADPIPDAVVLPPGPKGLRVRRIRLKSVMKLGAVFAVLGYLVTISSLVALWNVAQRLGFVDDVEDLVETSLGLDSFDVVGRDLFDLAVIGVGLLFAMGLVIALLLTIVYNAACMLFGGLALETGPLRRPRKVFSLRHRRFIDVR